MTLSLPVYTVLVDGSLVVIIVPSSVINVSMFDLVASVNVIVVDTKEISFPSSDNNSLLHETNINIKTQKMLKFFIFIFIPIYD